MTDAEHLAAVPGERRAREAALRGNGPWPGLRPKGADDVGAARLVEAAGWSPVLRNAVREAFDALAQSWVETGVATLGGVDHHAVLVSERGRLAFCLSRRDPERFMASVEDRVGVSTPSAAGPRADPVPDAADASARGRPARSTRDRLVADGARHGCASAFLDRAAVAAALGVLVDDPSFARTWSWVRSAVASGVPMPVPSGGSLGVASLPFEDGRVEAGLARRDLPRFAAMVAGHARQLRVARWCDRGEVAASLGLSPDATSFVHAWSVVERVVAEGSALDGGRVRVACQGDRGACVAYEDLLRFASVSRLGAGDLSLAWATWDEAAGLVRKLAGAGRVDRGVFSVMWASMMVEAQCRRPVLVGGREVRFERHVPVAEGWRMHLGDVPALVAELRMAVREATTGRGRAAARRPRDGRTSAEGRPHGRTPSLTTRSGRTLVMTACGIHATIVGMEAGMGDRVDLWGGLPDRPKPYFTAQRRRKPGDSPWDPVRHARRLRGVEEFSERDRLGNGPVPRRPARPKPSPLRTRRLGGRAVAIACAVVACMAFACREGDMAYPGRLASRLLDRAWHPGFKVLHVPAAYVDTDGVAHSALLVTGTMGSAAADVFASILETASPRPGDAVVLSSDGGDLGQAESIGDAVGARGLYTVVGTYGAGRFLPSYCVDACVAVFAAGAHRLQAAGSVVGLRMLSPAGAEGVARGLARPGLAYRSYLAALGGSTVPLTVGGAVWLAPSDVRRSGLADYDIQGL